MYQDYKDLLSAFHAHGAYIARISRFGAAAANAQ